MANEKKENATPNANPVPPTEKEMEAKRAEITAWYKENIKHLTVQLEYESLLRDIEKARAERVQSQMFLSQAMAGPQENQEVSNGNSQAKEDWDSTMDDAPPPRQLKKVESDV